MANVINVDLTGETINIEVGTDVINIQIGAISNIQPWAESDTNFPLNGEGGNTYLKFNSSTNRVELWVDGTLSKQFTKVPEDTPISGDPYA